jgi:hypothetical protein
MLVLLVQQKSQQQSTLWSCQSSLIISSSPNMSWQGKQNKIYLSIYHTISWGDTFTSSHLWGRIRSLCKVRGHLCLHLRDPRSRIASSQWEGTRLPLLSCRATHRLLIYNMRGHPYLIAHAGPSLSPPIAAYGDTLTSSHVRDRDYVTTIINQKTESVFLQTTRCPWHLHAIH